MELVIRATIIYWFLWLIVRGTGKRSLCPNSHRSISLITVVLGDFVQQGVTQEDMSMTGAIVVVSTFVGLDAARRRDLHGARRIESTGLDGEAVIVDARTAAQTSSGCGSNG